MAIEKLEMRHNFLEQLPKFCAPRLRELSIKYNGPLFQFEDDDVTMFVDRWPSLSVISFIRQRDAFFKPLSACISIAF